MNSFTLFFICAALTISCITAASAPHDCRIKAEDSNSEYSYDTLSDHGPSNWGDIEGFETCSTGTAQSPVDLPVRVNYAPLDSGPQPHGLGGMMSLHGKASNFEMVCDEAGECGHTTFSGKNFSVVNIHFHSPSEHRLNGTQFPLESHIVHASDDGQLVVIAIMFQYLDGTDYHSQLCQLNHMECGMNSFVSSMFTHLNKGQERFYVNIGSIINQPLGYCAYLGSLTTPPCTEGVTFLVSNDVKYINPRQVHMYNIAAGANFDGNARPVQPMNGRQVVCYM